MSAPMHWAQALEASTLGMWMRAGWGYPAANVLHLAGVVMLLGTIMLLDLRLLGYGRRLPAIEVSRLLTPIGVAGLSLAIVTGVCLFAADASALVASRPMQFKLLAVATAIINALAFRWRFSDCLAQWDTHPPPLGRASAALSLLCWPSVLILGRMIAYL